MAFYWSQWIQSTRHFHKANLSRFFLSSINYSLLIGREKDQNKNLFLINTEVNGCWTITPSPSIFWCNILWSLIMFYMFCKVRFLGLDLSRGAFPKAVLAEDRSCLARCSPGAALSLAHHFGQPVPGAVPGMPRPAGSPCCRPAGGAAPWRLRRHKNPFLTLFGSNSPRHQREQHGGAQRYSSASTEKRSVTRKTSLQTWSDS